LRFIRFRFTAMQKGTIARLMDKGYGFIKSADGGDKDLFFHANELQGA